MESLGIVMTVLFILVGIGSSILNKKVKKSAHDQNVEKDKESERTIQNEKDRAYKMQQKAEADKINRKYNWKKESASLINSDDPFDYTKRSNRGVTQKSVTPTPSKKMTDMKPQLVKSQMKSSLSNEFLIKNSCEKKLDEVDKNYDLPTVEEKKIKLSNDDIKKMLLIGDAIATPAFKRRRK